MATAVSAVAKLVSFSSAAASNPLVTASLLYALTKGPVRLRYRLLDTFTPLRDPQTFARVVKALKWLLALGTAGVANRALNHIALNSWRMNSEKSRWNLRNEVAVVTGGCSGIGELLVKRLVSKGIKVAVLDIQQLPYSLQNHVNIKFFACDIRDPEAVNSAAEQVRSSLGAPSILVNNAGIATAHTIDKTSPDWLRKVFEVNVFSNWYTVNAFLPSMVAKNKGHIVTVASSASYISVAGMTDYCATKAAILAFHEGLSQEIRYRHKAPNVLTTSVHPSWVRTPLIECFEKELRDSHSEILEPTSVADAIANQIFSCTGGQVFLPDVGAKVGGIRGWPNWMQDKLRTGVSKIVLNAAK